MIGDYIDTYGEVMQFIAFAYQKFGVKNIVFAQLTPLPKNDIYQEKIINFVEDRQVDVLSILSKIDSDSRFKLEKYRGGVACYYEVFKYSPYEEELTVLFKFSDNKYLVKADSYEQHCPDLIFHTDATLCGSWNKNIKKIIEAE